MTPSSIATKSRRRQMEQSVVGGGGGEWCPGHQPSLWPCSQKLNTMKHGNNESIQQTLAAEAPRAHVLRWAHYMAAFWSGTWWFSSVKSVCFLHYHPRNSSNQACIWHPVHITLREKTQTIWQKENSLGPDQFTFAQSPPWKLRVEQAFPSNDQRSATCYFSQERSSPL